MEELLKNFYPWKSCIVAMEVLSVASFASNFRFGSVREAFFDVKFF